MISGMIFLYNSADRLLSARKYHSVIARKDVFISWAELYYTNNRGLYYVIVPEAEPGKVKINGQNSNQIVRADVFLPRASRRVRGKANDYKPHIVRPPAIYDNDKSLYK